MFDSTIHAQTISRHFRKSDFSSSLWASTVDDKEEVVAEAVRIAENGFSSVAIRKNTLGGKYVYRQSSLSQSLLTRHVSDSVRRITKVHQSDRQSIIKSIVRLSSEGIPYKILKIDVKSFYESIDTSSIVSSLKADAAFSRQSIFVLESFFENLGIQHIDGLPRGVGLSATLAEYAMRAFDRAISSQHGVRYYSRYVDDAIAVLAYGVDAQEILEIGARHLPTGTEYNRRKTKIFDFKPFVRGSTGLIEHKISFLGYEIAIHEAASERNRCYRAVHTDIAEKKISRMKMRLSKTFLKFKDDRNFDDLIDRIKILTGNHGFLDEATGMQRYAGLRYNYNLIDPSRSSALLSLDQFYVNTLMSKHPNNRIRPNISLLQRKRMLGLGFKKGFMENTFFSFEEDRLKKLIGCWAHA